MVGHDWLDPILYADAMSELEAPVGPHGSADVVSPEVVPPWWRRLFGRRGYASA
jgi:hypothetical protein